MADAWVPKKVLEWDFLNHEPVGGKIIRSESGQLGLSEFNKRVDFWVEQSQKQEYCGLYSHVDRLGVCVLCAAVRVERRGG